MAETETAVSALPTTTTTSKKKPGKRDRNGEPKQSAETIIENNAVLNDNEEIISEGLCLFTIIYLFTIQKDIRHILYYLYHT